MADTQLRSIGMIDLSDVQPGGQVGDVPTFEWVEPASLLVDETYQRRLTERSFKMIRRIVAAWDWKKFKPPVVTRTAAGMKVIDGQHTAMAALAHPDVAKIPVMVIETASVADEASSFVGQNRDRLQLSPAQVHKAALVAGETNAVAIEEICTAAGVHILEGPPGRDFLPGETLAASTLVDLYARRGPELFTAIMSILGKANCAPIRANHLKALELLLTEAEYRDSLSVEDLADTFVKKGDLLDRQAGVMAATHRIRPWRAIAIILFRDTRHVRRRAA